MKSTESASVSASAPHKTPQTMPFATTNPTEPGADSAAPGENTGQDSLPTFREALDLLHSKGALTNLEIVLPER